MLNGRVYSNNRSTLLLREWNSRQTEFTTYSNLAIENGMAEWQNGGMVIELRNGGMAEWRNGGWNGGMAEWRNGGMAKWWNGGWNGGMGEWRNGGRMAEWSNGGMAQNGRMTEW